jgi:hypothetical protein
MAAPTSCKMAASVYSPMTPTLAAIVTVDSEPRAVVKTAPLCEEEFDPVLVVIDTLSSLSGGCFANAR